MNEMEHQLMDKTLESIHQLDIKMTAMQGEIQTACYVNLFNIFYYGGPINE